MSPAVPTPATASVPAADPTQPARGDRAAVSRRNLLRLALAGAGAAAGAAAAGPAFARTGLLGGESGVVQQATVAGVISGEAPMEGPRVPKWASRPD